MKCLKNHPFAVEAFFDRSLVLTFAVPKAHLQRLIPYCLELDTYQDDWAFVAVAMVQTTGLRPKGFPQWMGNDFFLIGYRVFVRFTTRAGKRLRGLYILRSETDKRRMAVLGNVFTHYNYTTTDIQQSTEGDTETIRSLKSNFHVTLQRHVGDIGLPAGSPFPDWKSARRFAGPLPHTFTYNAADKSVLIIEGVRQFWDPAPVQVQDYAFGFLDELHLPGIVLANAFEIRNIPYYWKKGRRELWT